MQCAQGRKTGSQEIVGILEDIKAISVMLNFCSIVNVIRSYIAPAHDLAVAATKHRMVA